MDLLVGDQRVRLEEQGVYESRKYDHEDEVYIGVDLQSGLENWRYNSKQEERWEGCRVRLSRYEEKVDDQV